MIDATGRYVSNGVTEDGKFVFGGITESGDFVGIEPTIVLLTTAVCQAYFAFNSIDSAATVSAATCYLQLVYPDQLMLLLSTHERTLSTTETTKRFTMTEV